MAKWTVENMPDLSGKIIIVTGANSGIGFDATKAFVQKGGHVILASRNVQKAETAVSQIKAETPNASTEIIQLDLADLTSIQTFANTFTAKHDQLDLLINNAGVMALPYRQTADGFEMQFGTNHLGHFALTGRLLNILLNTENSRVVSVSSGYHDRNSGEIDFDNLNGEKAYEKWDAYMYSKLANLLFAYELQRKLSKIGTTTISVGCHPGFAATNLQDAGPEMEGSSIQKLFMKGLTAIFAQSSEMGALPTLYAATATEVNGCDYIGPDGFQKMRGYPAKERSNQASYNKADAQKLWALSAELTQVTYDALPVER